MGGEAIGLAIGSVILAIWGTARVLIRRRNRRRIRLAMDKIDAAALSYADAYSHLRQDEPNGRGTD